MAQPLWLRIEGARQNNLKNVSLAIPHDRVTVITGVSGSGKSSLAFDTIFAEGQWRYIESLSAYARMFLERLDRPDVDRIEHIRPAIAIEQKNPVRTARSTVGTATELQDYLRLLFARIGRVHCPQCGAEARSDSAEQVADALVRDHAGARALICSFNHPLGACPECKGFGNILRYDEALVVPDQTRTLADGAVQPWSHPSGRWYQKQLLKAAKKRGLDTTRPYAELPAEDRKWIYEGADGFTGIQGFFEEVESYRYKLHVRVFLSRYRSPSPCPRCHGARLRPEALCVRIGGATVAELSHKTVEELQSFLDTLPL